MTWARDLSHDAAYPSHFQYDLILTKSTNLAHFINITTFSSISLYYSKYLYN